MQSIKEGLDEAANGPRVYDTEVIETYAGTCVMLSTTVAV